MIDWSIHPFIHTFIHSFIYPLKTKSVSWFTACSLFICCLLVLYVIWYNVYMLVCVCVGGGGNFPFFIFCLLFIYMYISSIWRNKSWNQIQSDSYWEFWVEKQKVTSSSRVIGGKVLLTLALLRSEIVF